MSARPPWAARPAGPLARALAALLVLLLGSWSLADFFTAPATGNAVLDAALISTYALRRDPLRTYRLKLDDFPYLAESRTDASLKANLLEPHNAHVVPLFRLTTWGLCRLAGDLKDVPVVFGHFQALVLLIAMLLVGGIVRRETGDRFLGLLAMIGVGLTSVIQPAATWYSAGQALLAGLMGLLMLEALQRWRRTSRPGWPWLLAAGACAAAAPLFWSGGHVAAPAGAAYLLAEPHRRHRRAAAVPLLAGLVMVPLTVLLAGAGGLSSGGEPVGWSLRAARAITHGCQAIPEVLIFCNLGLDVPTTPAQGVVLTMALAGLWAWSRRSARPTPLEAAGAVLVVGSYLLAFGFRAGYAYENLRELGWYHAIPQLGAVLFAAGWYRVATRPVPAATNEIARREPNGSFLPPLQAAPRGRILLVLGLAVVAVTLNGPRVLRQFLATVRPMDEAERMRFPIPELQRLRATYLADEDAARQRRALARLDRAERLAQRLSVGRTAIRGAVPIAPLPGWPSQVRESVALELLDLPEAGQARDPLELRRLFAPLFALEPEPAPPWATPEVVLPTIGRPAASP